MTLRTILASVAAMMTRATHGSPIGAVARGNAILLVSSLLTGLIAARGLGPSGRGEYAASASWSAAVAVAMTLGVTQAAVVYKESLGWYRYWILVQVAGSALVGVLMCTGLRLFGSQGWLNAGAVVGVALMTAGAVASSLTTGLMQRSGQMIGGFQAARLLPQAALVASMLGLWFTDVVSAWVWLLVAGSTAGMTAIVLLLWFGIPVLRAERRGTPGDGRGRFTALAAGALVIAVGAQLIYRLDALVVAVSMNPGAVGLYAVALGAGAACFSLGTAAGMVMFSELRSATGHREMRRLIVRALALGPGIAFGVALPAFVFARPIIEIVYGSAFLPALAATRISLAASVVLVADYILVHAVLSIGAKRYLFAVQLVVVALTLGLLWPATRTGNVANVAGVSLVTYPVSVALHLCVIIWKTRASTPASSPI